MSPTPKIIKIEKMGRKKRDLSHVKPFCYFCEKIFPNENVLHEHQKSHHYRCHICFKKFPTTQNYVSHMNKMHGVQVTKIPNAIEGRDSCDVNIFGMNGVPKHIVRERMVFGAAKYRTKIQRDNQLAGKSIGKGLIDVKNLPVGVQKGINAAQMEIEKPKEPVIRSIRNYVKIDEDEDKDN